MIQGLFSKIGPLVKVELVYDRAGRSEGTAYVTYEEYQDAKEAVREFDGANAKGQPIRLGIVPSAPRRNPFDTAQMPGRSLADRITVPSGRSRSYSPDMDRDRGIDRYVPTGGRRSRSPLPRRRGGGRRPGQRREGGGRNAGDGERKGREGRPKKTQEELDAEMADYFNPNAAPSDAQAAPAAEGQAAAATAGGAVDDVDMIE
jgi:THO complex subunit 4